MRSNQQPWRENEWYAPKREAGGSVVARERAAEAKPKCRANRAALYRGRSQQFRTAQAFARSMRRRQPAPTGGRGSRSMATDNPGAISIIVVPFH